MVVDPATTLSVVAAVVQFIDFSAKLVSKGKEIHKSKDGVLTSHAEQIAISSRLAELSRGLSNSIPASRKTSSSPEIALREVTLDCIKLADDITEALNKLEVCGNHTKWKSFRQALKSVWSKEEIGERLMRLDRLREKVIIHLLVVMK